jgi:hypothetical protein
MYNTTPQMLDERQKMKHIKNLVHSVSNISTLEIEILKHHNNKRAGKVRG